MIPSNLLRDLVSESNTVQDHVEDIGHLKDPKKYISVSRDCNNGVNDDPLSVAKVIILSRVRNSSIRKYLLETLSNIQVVWY